ncbi:Succinyl-CoA--L-malate CoA-transferase beta subunit [Mycobacterium simulans]|uniref:Succinyl-CoA--L-malate CoA-transferase beta subunit n=2 Tax=Mycobacterium simulans TaxID=627089 RepID=A0A7Z7N8S8_9MYCO|nr:Succinyl-CoA--L-malate CoA-transferase beta subunit [Mycobacterium simulans]
MSTCENAATRENDHHEGVKDDQLGRGGFTGRTAIMMPLENFARSDEMGAPPACGGDRRIAATGPLDGIRVLELGTLIAGPFAGRLLGDMGAEVIKIEPPGAPDPLRTWGQAEVDGHHFFWTVHARNKKAVTLDLRRPRGRELFLELVDNSDIVVENFRPGTLEKWNLGYDELRDRNPGIVLVRVSGYGQTGPESHKAGYASMAEAASGLRHLNGFPGGPPPRLSVSLGDSLAGMFAAQGALAALYRRGITGQGQVVDVALTEACLAVQDSTIPDYDVAGVVRGPSGTRLEGIAPSNIYRSADGHWVVIAANQDSVFARLCQAMGRPELATDERFANHRARGRNQDELDEIIGDWAAQRKPGDIIETLSAAGVIAGPINTVADVVMDPQLRARGMLVDHYDDRIERNVLGPGVVPVLSESPGRVRHAGPAHPGQHNDDVYVGLLGKTAAELTELRAEAVI